MPKTKADVCLIGYEEGENLGLRSIAAFLQRNGVRVELLPYDPADEAGLARKVRAATPAIVGFSLIFQRMLPDFAELITRLRQARVKAHFTMGGHFPTVEPRALLAAVPGLDSVVRGEGEYTLLDLLRAVDRPESWPEIPGLAYRVDGEIRLNPPRPLIADLDTLPFPLRNPTRQQQRRLGLTTLLASRGCYFNCSFCSIRAFYTGSPGPVRRSRSPANVVREMVELYERHGSRIFIFEDDDFLTRNRVQRRWVQEFVRELRASGIGGDILFRISCRVDDVEEDLVCALREVGLMCVYLGIEAGNSEGLKVYNKHYGVADIHKALAVLLRSGVPYEFGFMILHPYSTLAAVQQDIAFLKEINEHKQAVFQFTKVLPYSGTPLNARLAAEGRLLGPLEAPDYTYADDRLEWLQAFFTQAFHVRNFERHGLVTQLRFAKFDALITEKFFADRWDGAAYFRELRELIYRGNAVCLDKMSLAARYMERLDEQGIMRHWPFLAGLVREEREDEEAVTRELHALMLRNGFPG